MKKRWVCLFVENEVGVLARISGLFAGKAYNLNSLTVGPTEDETISRMTISLTSDDRTFEQVKKQLNRAVEVIKVLDLTEEPVHRKELMFVKIHSCSENEIRDLFRIAQVYPVKILDYDFQTVLLESLQTEEGNDGLICLLKKNFPGRAEIVRGGSVAVGAVLQSP
ncbi:acetolactate synthase small subunit [Cuneatibacter sp. NSJ-177]|uniref:acetolactate synthase small subunit n=1 Tax=Cuneatibacter sp. NSJ-177 TaxID=2931401 RepID=UPI001FD09493|nr:acetolactate synthase small subunit [Cuneatibacter sp. NSJ-177]MCJ7833979.1 acetolactate synthase small subunit [Cuneatibacter sp. NSJ-177]